MRTKNSKEKVAALASRIVVTKPSVVPNLGVMYIV
jgi:hypothetical protein